LRTGAGALGVSAGASTSAGAFAAGAGAAEDGAGELSAFDAGASDDFTPPSSTTPPHCGHFARFGANVAGTRKDFLQLEQVPWR
jgi:hypothetical protein